ncbi:MAG: tetratricopeptide repeat protein [Gammaproteobacteria bacterium]|nr:tetratricopeptide repeat protein [Gammaproteobacteria bacterium]
MKLEDHEHSESNPALQVIGEWTFYPKLYQLRRKDEVTRIEPRVAHLLLILVQSGGEPLTREALIEEAWSGMVVGDEALTSAINKLRKAFGDDPQHSQYIETIPKIGYRLIAQVKSPSSEKPLKHASFAMRYRLLLLIMITTSIISFVGYTFWISSQSTYLPSSPAISEVSTANSPTVAVLPFLNISNNSAQEYLSDGISESLITDLSRLSGITVIARHSSFSHKGREVSIEQIGEDLGAQYVLDGSVQIDGSSLRISAQLIDTETGHQLWAQRFDKNLGDVFELQDEITHEVVTALSVRLESHEQIQSRNKHPDSFEAYDLFLRGQQVSVQFSGESIAEAIKLYRSAIKLDPNYAHAYSALAVGRIREFLLGVTDTPVLNQDRALELALKATKMDPNSHKIQWSLGYVHLYRKEFEEGETAARRSIMLSPSYADGYSLLALFKNNLGMSAEAIPLIEKAMQLNPHYTWDYIYQLGRAHYTLGNHADAADHLTQAIERNEAVGYPRLFLAAAYVNLDQIDDAEWELELLQAFHPEYLSRAYLQKTMPIGDPKLMNRLLNDLKMAGLPD